MKLDVVLSLRTKGLELRPVATISSVVTLGVQVPFNFTNYSSVVRMPCVNFFSSINESRI